ncbi:MAG TPA: N-6 DNA methylase [Bacilli bacterium]
MRDYSLFYTPVELAKLLITECNIKTPDNIVDICAGSWNLLNEARVRWPESTIVGVDIDGKSKSSIMQDGRVYSQEALTNNLTFDLVVANPPFQYEEVNSGILEFINKYTNHFEFEGYIYSRLESTMMLFNSFLVKEGGVLASIIPTGIINSVKQNSLRLYLSKDFSIEKIIRLPSDAFGQRNINTSMIILKRGSQLKGSPIYEAFISKGKYKTTFIGEISIEDIKNGRWDISEQRNLDVNKYDIQILRNKISSIEMKHNSVGYPVIHSTTITQENMINPARLGFVQQKPNVQHLTSCGDIVIIRVGKYCGRYSLIGSRESDLLTSDCVFLIKTNNDKVSHLLLKKLKTINFGQLKKGVAARYITKDILNNIFFEHLETIPSIHIR